MQYGNLELRQLHQELYDILQEIVRVCDLLSIPYFIQGGSGIGAFFEQAILPWDDDIDVGMTRENYRRFLLQAPAVLRPQYYLQTPDNEAQSPFYFAKLRKQGTVFLEHHFRRLPIHHGIYVDVFPFDRVPDNERLQRLHRAYCNFVNGCFMAKVVWQWKHIKACEVDEPRPRGFLPCLLTWLVCQVLSRRTLYRHLSWAQALFNGRPTTYYNMVLMPRDHIAVKSIDHPQTVTFGPLSVTAPSDLESYLRHHYPRLRRHIPKEEQTNHRPDRLVFADTAAHITTYAPVALFTYNRLDNTRRTLEALMQNTLAPETDVYVFSDGGRDEQSWAEVRAVREMLTALSHEALAAHRFRSMTIVKRPANIYLERNIMEGIAEVFDRHDRIVVLEDDILTSPYFLQYMNEALTLYHDCPRVMHVSGFTNSVHPVPSREGEESPAETYFTPHMSGWGWATWRDRWQQHFRHFGNEQEGLEALNAEQRNAIEYGGVFPCLRSLRKQPIPWDICWEIAIRRADGLCLTPAQTLVRNIGLYRGTHFRSYRLLQHYEFDRQPLQRPILLERVEPQSDPAHEAAFAHAIRDWGIRYTWLGRIVRAVYKRLRSGMSRKRYCQENY